MQNKFMFVALFVLVVGVVISAWVLLPTPSRAGSASSSSAVIPSNPSKPSATISGSMLEQDELLERLLAEPHLAELAQLTPAQCDDECLAILTQQMWDLAEQVRRGW